MHCAVQAAKEYNLGGGSRVVVLLPDNIRNYMLLSFDLIGCLISNYSLINYNQVIILEDSIYTLGSQLVERD